MTVQITRPGFSSAKCRVPILYPRRWHREALIQIALDHRVKMIASRDSEDDFCVELTLTTGATKLARFVDSTASRKHAAEEDGADIVVTRSAANSQPRRSVARELWAQRESVVSVGDRMRVMLAVEKAASIGISIANLASAVHAPNVDAFATIARLICDGLLSIDLDTALSPRTMVIPGALWPVSVESFSASAAPNV